MSSRAKEINLEKDRKSEKSVFEFYKKVLQLRKESETIRFGTFKDITENDECFVYERELDDNKIVVAVNFDKQNKVTLPDYLKRDGYKTILANYENAEPFDENFRPFEIRVFSK